MVLLSQKVLDVRMCLAGDTVEEWRSDISKQGRSVRLVK